MERELSETKIALIRAAESIFAEYGIDGARATDILRAADQANESAINYHFGSRWGLVVAIIGWHLAEMEEERVLSGGSLRDLVADIIGPVSGRLATPEGRHFLRIVNQVLDRVTPAPATGVPAALEDTVLLSQMAALYEALTHLSPRARADRIQHFVVFHAAALATRARRIDAGEEEALIPHDDFVAELVDLLTAVLAVGRTTE